MHDFELILRRLVTGFERVRVEIMIGGSGASSALGLGRMTNDIDIVADNAIDKAPKLVDEFSADFYIDLDAVADAAAHHGTFNMLHNDSFVKVDVFVLKTDDWSLSEWSRKQPMQIGTLEGSPIVHVATAEDLVLQKLYWYDVGRRDSDRQWSDVAGILKVQRQSLDHEYLKILADKRNLADLLKRALVEADNCTWIP